MSVRLCAGVALLLAASAVWATTKGVKNIDIIVKKRCIGCPATAVRTDGGGTARFSLTEPGEYEIEFRAGDASPKAPPERGFAVALSGEVRVRKAITKSGSRGFAAPDTIALGRMTLDANTERVRLAYPRIDLANGIHTERITTFGPVDVMLRLTEEVPDPAVPGITGLPRRLEYVAVEGGPAPARQAVSVTSDTGTDWQIQLAPVDRISASFSKSGGRLAPGASDIVDVSVQAVGLAPGVYKGQISIVTSSGGQAGEPAYIPLYLRVLPRAQVIDPVVSRRTLVFADDAGTQSLEVTNPNAVPQNYLLEAADAAAARAVRITPAQLALQPGQSGRIAVSFVGEAPGPFTLRLTPQGQPPVNIFAFRLRTRPPQFTSCVATELIPVLASVDPQIGEDATGTVEVYDNCGRRVRDVVVKVETESGASFFGINDGVSNIKVGLGKNPPGNIKVTAIAKDSFGGEITIHGDLTLAGRALPALAAADKPFEIVEIVDAATGEPGVVAPGAQFVLTVITKSSSNIKNNFSVPVQELRGQTVSIGDRVLDIIGETEDGEPVVEVPTDLGPQQTTILNTTKAGIKTQPRALAVAPAAPALITRANPDGTPGRQAPIFKLVGEALQDYAVDGGASPKAGDIVALGANGLGAVDADGNVLGAVKLLVGGVEAKVRSARKDPPIRIRDDLGGKPGYVINAEMPEIKSLDGGVSPASTKIVVDDIESAEAITPPVEKLQTTKVTLTVTPITDASPYWNYITYKIDGNEYSGTRTFQFDKDTEVSFEAPLTLTLPSTFSPRFRMDYLSWGGKTVNQFKVVLSADTNATLEYAMMGQLAITGAVTISPLSADGYYRHYHDTFTANASCPSGQVLSSLEVTNNLPISPPFKYNVTPAALPSLFGAIGYMDFKAICNAAANVNLTVTTNPAGLGVRIGTTGSFTPGPITQQVPANQAATIATQTPQTVNGTGYTFTGWSTGGAATTTTVTPTANTTVTANFSVACHVLTINATGGTVTANPLGSVTGFQNNCYPPRTLVTHTPTPKTGNPINGWSGDATGTTSPTTVTMTGPKSVTANFGAPGNVTLNLTTVPAGLNVRIGANSAFNPSPFSQQVPANQSTTIEAVPTQVLNGTGYRFANWSTGATTPATTVQPSSNLTATATYTVACHTLTVNTTGPGTVMASPQSNITGFASNCYAPGTTVVLTANPNTGSAFTSWSGDATGSTSPTSITMNAPKTVNAAFGAPANVTLTVTTNPAGLGVRIGSSGGFTAGPVSQQVPAGQSQTIATDSPQIVNGVGYRFTGWSTGGSTPVTTVQPSSNFTATANFQVACYLVTTSAAGGGTVDLNPPSGGVSGFPANCYAPGVQVRILANAGLGFGLRDVAINIGGSASTVTTPNTPINVTGPVTAAATYIPRPATISTIFPPVLVSGTTYRDNVFFSNPTPTPGNSLQITNVTFQTTAGSGTVTLQSSLPIVFGALPANGQSSTQQILFNIPATVTGYNIFATVEVKNANGDTFTNVVSVGQTK